MTVNSIMTASPASAIQKLNLSPATLPDGISAQTPASTAPLSFSNLNDAHTNGPGSIRTGLQIIPSPGDAANLLQSSALQIARLQANPEQPTALAASAVYMTQAAATQQGRPNGSQSVNLMA